jgi:hypothetical protein
VTFADPIVAALAALKAALAGRSEPYAQGLTYSNHRPPQHELPAVQVALDGDQVTYPLQSQPLLRITCWHIREDWAYSLAQLCQAVILTHGDATIIGSGSATGPVPGVDPVGGDAFATFTINTRTRPTALTK